MQFFTKLLSAGIQLRLKIIHLVLHAVRYLLFRPQPGLLALISSCSHSPLCLCFRREQLDQGRNFLSLMIIILMLKYFLKSKRKAFMMLLWRDFHVKGKSVIMATVQFLGRGRKALSTCADFFFFFFLQFPTLLVVHSLKTW